MFLYLRLVQYAVFFSNRMLFVFEDTNTRRLFFWNEALDL